MFRLAIFALTLTLGWASLEANWLVYKNTYNKIYTEDEDDARRNIWQTNLQKIKQHNELYAQGLSSFFLGENQFTDKTAEEIKAMNGLKITKRPIQNNYETRIYKDDVPDAIDWRQKGAVTPVKDQGLCSGCWAFSTTGVVEAAHFKATGQLVSLSESNLIDCSQKYSTEGCRGGLVEDALQYIIDNKGIDTEDSYPFVAETETCQYNPANIGATITSVTNVQAGSEDALKQAVAENGPISIAIDADDLNFRHYEGGIYDNPSCNNTHLDLDHALLVVGYGSQDGQDYWIVKNSWGEIWGDNGYGLMSRNKNNQCGIATRAMYPVV